MSQLAVKACFSEKLPELYQNLQLQQVSLYINRNLIQYICGNTVQYNNTAHAQILEYLILKHSLHHDL